MCFSLWSRRTPYSVCFARGARRPPTLAIAAQRSSIAADPQLRSVGDGDAHRAGGAADDLRPRFDVVGVEVGHLALRDLADLRLADVCDLLRVRLAGALL